MSAALTLWLKKFYSFASVRVIRGSISSSRRWRQVGGPRRVRPYRFKSSAPHPAEPELPSARAKLRALRSAARRPWSRSFAPLSPVPPEVEPYLPFFCSKSLSYFRVRSRDSRFNFFLTPMATSGRTTAGQALPQGGWPTSIHNTPPFLAPRKNPPCLTGKLALRFFKTSKNHLPPFTSTL
jgi:hypothetical protein